MAISTQYPIISTRYPTMAIGGVEDKVNGCDILTAFFQSAGGKMSAIGIVTCASQEPSIVGDRYNQIFGKNRSEKVDSHEPSRGC